MRKTKKVQAGISLDAELLTYVDGLRECDDPLYRRRPRSQIIGLIIEEHARKNGFTPYEGKLTASA